MGRGDENTEYVWYYFPITSKYAEEKALEQIPRLHIIRDLWSIFDVIKNVESSRGIIDKA